MPSQADMKAALQAYIDAYNAGDLDKIVGLYATDCQVEDPVGNPPMKGPAAVREFYQGAFSTGAKLRLTAGPNGSHGNSAAMAFEAVLPNGAYVRVIDVMTFNDAGKFASMKAYWGPEDFIQPS